MGKKSSGTPGAIDYVEDAARWAAAGRPDHAANLYAIALDLEPGHWHARMQRAACLASAERPGEAAQEYVKIARHYATQRSMHEALAVGHRILQLDPQCFSPRALGDVLRAIGADAAPLCRKAARMLREGGRDDHAADLLRLCAELSPGDVEPWRELAQLYVDHHMVPEAVRALRYASQQLRAVGNHELYVEFAKTLLWLDPQDLDTLRELPRVLMLQGQPHQAVAELSALFRANPGDVVGYETLAQAFATIGRLTASASVLEQLTVELARSGRRTEAEAIIERARTWRPGDHEFDQRVLALYTMQPSTPIDLNAPDHPTTSDGTVVLSLADITRGVQEGAPHENVHESGTFDATDLVELVDHEDSVILRLSDLSRVRRAPAQPKARLREPLLYGQTEPSGTQLLDLRDLEQVPVGEAAQVPREQTLQGVAMPRRWTHSSPDLEDDDELHDTLRMRLKR